MEDRRQIDWSLGSLYHIVFTLNKHKSYATPVEVSESWSPTKCSSSGRTCCVCRRPLFCSYQLGGLPVCRPTSTTLMCMAIPRDLRSNAVVPINSKLNVQIPNKATMGLLPLHMTQARSKDSQPGLFRNSNLQWGLLVSIALFLVMKFVISFHNFSV